MLGYVGPKVILTGLLWPPAKSSSDHEQLMSGNILDHRMTWPGRTVGDHENMLRANTRNSVTDR